MKLWMPMDMFYFLAGQIHNKYGGSDVRTLSLTHIIAQIKNIFFEGNLPICQIKIFLPYNLSHLRLIPVFKNYKCEYPFHPV